MKTKLLLTTLVLFISIGMNAQNAAPIAHAGIDQNARNDYVAYLINKNSTNLPPDDDSKYQLDGSLSYDPDGDNITYTWTSLENVPISDIHAVKPIVTIPYATSETVYHFTLTVNDGQTTSVSDEVTITEFITGIYPGIGFRMRLITVPSQTVIYAVTINGYDNANPSVLSYRYQYLYTEDTIVIYNLYNVLKPEFVALLPPTQSESYGKKLFPNAALLQQLDENLINTLDFSNTWSIVNHTQINPGPTSSIVEEEDANRNGVLETNEINPVTSQSDIDLQKYYQFLPPAEIGSHIWTSLLYLNDELYELGWKDIYYESNVRMNYVTLNRYFNDASTGINNHANKENYAISPNPANECFTVSGISENTPITVFDISGKRVIEKTVNPNEKISVTDWNKGIYLVKVNDKTAKLIVK